MSKKLYPLKFEPILKETIWGGTKLHTKFNKPLIGMSNIAESWEISGVEGNVTVVSNGFLKGNSLNEIIEIYMGDVVGDRVFEKFGHEFPLLIKFIDANQALSIQVHPDDKLAQSRHNSFGKTEMWYVMQAQEGAELISGFGQNVTAQKYVEAVNNKSIESLLAKHKVTAGDVFFIPAGRVHAIGAGILLAEIQQTSNITYRIYDFDRLDPKGNPRELHTEQALDAIDFKYHDNYKTEYTPIPNESVELANCSYFTTNVIEADKAFGRDYYSLDSFVVLMCMQGRAIIEFGEGSFETVDAGETILIPAELRQIKIVPQAKLKMLEVYMPL
jgi:mannose-6-phosphate isomerase